MKDALRNKAQRPKRILRAALALILLAAMLPIGALVPTRQAHAAPADPPATLSGRFTLSPGFTCGPTYEGDFPGTVALDGGYTLYCFGDNGAGDNGRAACISPGAANWGDPSNSNNRSGTVNATWYSNDPDKHIAWYRMTVTPDIQPAVGVFGIQYLGATWLAITWDFEGWVHIVKSSTDPAISSGSGYSLAGAVFELRRSSDGTLVDTLTTDVKGEATSKALAPGSYYLTEVTAPPGFKLDTAAHNVTVAGGNTATVHVTDAPLGWVELVKSSSNPAITEGNRCYSLAGAVYGVYGSTSDAMSDTNRITTLTTDDNGYARSSGMVALGTLYALELVAPPGYAADPAVYRIEHNSAATRTSVVDRPQTDPEAMFVGKVDADTTADMPQGSASLAGAVYTIRYFDGYFSTAAEAEGSGLPMRVWYVRTDGTGKAMLRESYLAAGSDTLYHNSYGDAVIPLGTVVIEETTAPVGYLLPTPALISVQQLTATSKMEHVTTYNAPIVPEQIMRGDIALVKAYNPVPEDSTGVMVPESGIAFDFYASRDFSGPAPHEGAPPAFTLVTDADGHADSYGTYVIANPDGTYTQKPRTDKATGGVPYDSYLMVQRNAPAGFEGIAPMLVTVAEQGKTYGYLLQNGTAQTALRVVKVDSETGLAVPYPASWQIIDAATKSPVSMTVHYPAVETLDTFTSDTQGRLMLPERLPYGDYELCEAAAPFANGTGYVLNPVSVPFKAEGGHGWGDPLTVTFADAPAKGRIVVEKTDAYTGGPVAGATYVIRAVGDTYTLDGTLRAKDGEVVDTLTTDADGTATSKELYLGRYDVVEAISPEGYALDTVFYGVTLEYADQTAAVIAHKLELSDRPTTLHLLKVDAITGKAIPGVGFNIEGEARSFDVVTGADGRTTVACLPHGTYTVTETGAPFGYASNPGTRSFEVDERGLIEGHDSYELVVKNAPIEVGLSKTDITTGNELPGCGLAVYEADEDGSPIGEPLYEWTSTDEPHTITGGLAPGSYVLHEDYPATGYASAQDVAFAVLDTGDAQKVVMTDDTLKVEVSKRDITTDAELPGAHLSIHAADGDGKAAGAPLYEWTSGFEPYLVERIPAGDYILREDASPAGYALAQDVAFTVTDTGVLHKVVMYDAAKPTVPKTPDTPDTPTPGKGFDKTGQDTTVLLAVFALLVAGGITGLALGLYSLRKKKGAGPEDAEDIGLIDRDE